MSPAETAPGGSALPLVTIVTPTYNQADYLAESIDSVLAQDYPNIEYVVIDDGSTDRTREILQRYEGRIRWESQENMGQAATLNKGWSLGNGKYLGYLSSDDILYKTAITELVGYLIQQRDVAMVYPNCDLIDPYSRIIKKDVAKPFDYDELVVKQECGIGPGALFRAECFDRLGGWLPWLKLAPDREFWMRVGLSGRITMLNKTLAAYRMHDKSISYAEVSPHVAEEYLMVLDRYYARGDIPERLIARRNEAYAHARIVICRNRLRSGDFLGARRDYKEAVRLCPSVGSVLLGFQLARTAISKPVRRAWWTVKRIVGL